MADYIIDLKKDGNEFCTLANSFSNESIVHLPNSNLSKTLRDQLSKVYFHMFGEEFLVEDDVYSFLLNFREGAFSKIYYPCVVKGCTDNALANDPEKLYIRWGLEFFELAVIEEKKGNKYTQSFFSVDGNELDAEIVGYGFNGAKYIDPALAVTIMDEDDDSYVMHFPIKLNMFELDPDGTQKDTDFVPVLKTAAKRGMKALLELISEAKEYKAFAKTINPAELELGIVYESVKTIISQSSAGKDIVKLVLSTPHIDEAGEAYDEVWCPFELMNYIKQAAVITETSPAYLVLTGLTTEVSKSNGRTYTKPLVAITTNDSSVLEIGAAVPGERLEEAKLAKAYEETVEFAVKPYRYAPTLSDRDLDIDVLYPLKGYVKLSNATSTFYKLDIQDPGTKKLVKVWCPNKLIATLLRAFPLQEGETQVTIDQDCFFKVVNKTTKGDKVYANSIIDFGAGVNPDSDGINLSFLK